MEIKFRNSIALVKNIETSRKFYRDVIGLQAIEDFETFVLFQDNFAIHTADLFYEYINKTYHGEKLGRDNVEFYITTSDLSAMEQKLRESNVEFIHGIRQFDWGEKAIRILDPDGHILEIGDAHK